MIENSGPMLNAYPDSMGGTLGDIADFLENPELKDVFTSFYILPSLFHTDLDRGFSVIDYSLNRCLAKKEDLEAIGRLGMDLKLDFILNHASVLSEQFQDIIKNGESSKYRDFFIDWNKFWQGHGTMTDEGYIQPDEELIREMFFRKPGLPVLMVRFPDGSKVPYWNTFYQEVQYPVPGEQELMQAAGLQYGEAKQLAEKIRTVVSEGKNPCAVLREEADARYEAVIELLERGRKYLGQMDLNIKSPLVWQFYEDTLRRLSEYGAKIVRLDAFAYAPKEPGEKNFLNEPGTWDLLKKVRALADEYQLTLLPEIHAGYGEGCYEKIAAEGYMTYDFFLPGLVIDAFESACGDTLCKWATELKEKKIRVVNMLGCHDGIPLLDLKGMIPEARIRRLIDTLVERGGYVKDLHGQKNLYYQVNETYYSALGESDARLLLARAIQIFMPGKPQVWYLDLFAGKNDHDAVKRAGEGGHKEINRTNLTAEQIKERLAWDVVKDQIKMLRFRAKFPAFGFDAALSVESSGEHIHFRWEKGAYAAVLDADLKAGSFVIRGTEHGAERYCIKQGKSFVTDGT